MLMNSPGIDRRSRVRYPISLSVSYRCFRPDIAGLGSTINISSSGLLFRAECPPPVNSTLDLTLEWPALLNEQTPLQLKLSGRVIRADSTDVVVRIQRYGFHTRRLLALSQTMPAAQAVRQLSR